MGTRRLGSFGKVLWRPTINNYNCNDYHLTSRTVQTDGHIQPMPLSHPAVSLAYLYNYYHHHHQVP